MSQLNYLLYIPAEFDEVGIHHELVSQLAQALEANAKVTLATPRHRMALPPLAEFHLVHVFGCWNAGAAKLLAKAYKLHIPTVYTPLGGLQPWMMRQHRTVRLMTLQRRMVRLASAVHVCGKLEYETFVRLGWNPRVALIKNPVLTSLFQFDDFCLAIQRLYRKVMDTNARLLLTDRSKQAVAHLLQLGVDDDALRDSSLCAAVRQELAELAGEDWRMIWLYAADEHVDETLKKGLERIQFAAPTLVIEDVERFASNTIYASGSLPDGKILSRNILLRNKFNENIKEGETEERRLCIGMLNLKYELEHRRAPLQHLVDAYVLTRYHDVDEDRLKELFQLVGIEDFCARTMAVMGRMLGLTEGFMPLPPRDDTEARRLEAAMTKTELWPE